MEDNEEIEKIYHPQMPEFFQVSPENFLRAYGIDPDIMSGDYAEAYQRMEKQWDRGDKVNKKNRHR